MGQYYLAILLAEKELTKVEFIRAWLSPHSFDNGFKLMEHSYLNNNFVATLETLISPDGMFYKSRVVWAGDYADNEPDSEENLHGMTGRATLKEIGPGPLHRDWSGTGGNILNSFWLNPTFRDWTEANYRYVVNHTKKQYVDKEHVLEEAEDKQLCIHPLPLLTAEGNGRGNGDYRTESDLELVGTWARDVISVERQVPEPESYTELVCKFK